MGHRPSWLSHQLSSQQIVKRDGKFKLTKWPNLHICSTKREPKSTMTSNGLLQLQWASIFYHESRFTYPNDLPMTSNSKYAACQGLICGPIVAVLFFSLDQPLTKNQILSTKCHPRFLASSQFQKRRGQPGLFFFSIWNDNKKLQLTFVFSYRLLQWKEHMYLCIIAMLCCNIPCSWTHCADKRQDNIIFHGDKNETAHFILTIGLMFAKGIPLLPFTLILSRPFPNTLAIICQVGR